MYQDETEDTTIYTVVVNHEEQYSIWPAQRDIPLGWKEVGKSGLKAECLEYVKEVWTDMRPLSLRKQMEEAAKKRAEEGSEESHSIHNVAVAEQEPDLVTRLCEGDHPVEITLRPEPSIPRLKECLDRNYIHIKFTDTKGGTELGVPLDMEKTDLTQADFSQETGKMHLVGNLTLDYVKVSCIAEVDVKTLTGRGHLERAED